MKKVVLVRGPSGCGKSTHVKGMAAHYVGLGYDVAVCSADDFFVVRVPVVRNGVASQETVLEYRFDPVRLGEAHAVCFGKFLDCVQEDVGGGDRLVIVDNTFIHKWEMRNYIKAANFADCVVEVHEFRVETITQLRLCVARNVHRVPADIVARMAMEFEPYDKAMVVPFGGLT